LVRFSFSRFVGLSCDVSLQAGEAQGQGRAIPFITQQASGALTIESEAASFLRSVEAPFGVISVVGMHRTGKSYLINMLLLEQEQKQNSASLSGFKVGKGLSTCTKGVWIYNQVVQLARPDGSNARFLVLDTEGTGAADGDEQRDVLTWALTLLLSSYLVYNSVGSIDEASISQLSLVTHVAGLLHTRDPINDNSSSAVASTVAEFFPSFLWLLRDFSLELVSASGEPISEKQYLDRALQPVDASLPEAHSKNCTRKTLRNCFRHLNCCTMVRPAIDEDILQRLGSTPVSETRHAFQEQLSALRGRVLADCLDKRIGGALVGGAGLLALCESFVSAVAGSDGPAASLADAYADAAKAMAEHALKDASTKLCAALQPLSQAPQPSSDMDLEQCVGEAARSARRSLQTHLGFSADAVAQNTIDKLEDEILKKRRCVGMENDAKAEQLLARLYSEVQTGVLSGRYGSLHLFLADHARIRSTCALQVSRAVLAEFLERSLLEGVICMADRHKEQDALRDAECLRLQHELTLLKDKFVKTQEQEQQARADAVRLAPLQQALLQSQKDVAASEAQVVEVRKDMERLAPLEDSLRKVQVDILKSQLATRFTV